MSPILSRRFLEGSRRPVLRVLDSGERREQPAGGLEEAVPRRPELRIVPGGGREPTPREAAPVLLVIQLFVLLGDLQCCAG